MFVAGLREPVRRCWSGFGVSVRLMLLLGFLAVVVPGALGEVSWGIFCVGLGRRGDYFDCWLAMFVVWDGFGS